MKPVILIHPFQVDQGQEEIFLDAWHKVDRYMQEQEGFIETKLHCSLNIGNLTPFSYVNIAKWESVDLFRNAVSNETFTLLAKNVLVFSRGAGLYECIF